MIHFLSLDHHIYEIVLQKKKSESNKPLDSATKFESYRTLKYNRYIRHMNMLNMIPWGVVSKM